MLPIDKIRDLYFNQKLSSREVGNKLGISKWSILSAMRRSNIPRRTASEADQIAFSKKPLSYRRKENLTTFEKRLHLAGLMLYWAEGAKRGRWTIDFTNCDKQMVLLFISTLRRVYQIDESKLRIQIYCHANQKTEYLIAYWAELLKIPVFQFTKPYVNKNYVETKKDRMPWGLVHIRYCDKRLFMQIKTEIDIIQKELIC